MIYIIIVVPISKMIYYVKQNRFKLLPYRFQMVFINLPTKSGFNNIDNNSYITSEDRHVLY